MAGEQARTGAVCAVARVRRGLNLLAWSTPSPAVPPPAPSSRPVSTLWPALAQFEPDDSAVVRISVLTPFVPLVLSVPQRPFKEFRKSCGVAVFP